MKVGDRVRVRQWDDLVKEYGVNEEGAIKGMSFTAFMSEVCGLEGTIRTCANAFVTIVFDAPIDAVNNYWVFAKETVEVTEEAPEVEPMEEAIFPGSNLDVLHREVLAGEDDKALELWYKLDDFSDFSDLMVWLNKPLAQEKEAPTVDDLK